MWTKTGFIHQDIEIPLQYPQYRSVSPLPSARNISPHPHQHVSLRKVWRQNGVSCGGWGNSWRMVRVVVFNFGCMYGNRDGRVYTQWFNYFSKWFFLRLALSNIVVIRTYATDENNWHTQIIGTRKFLFPYCTNDIFVERGFYNIFRIIIHL